MSNNTFYKNRTMCILAQIVLFLSSAIVVLPIVFVFLTSLKDNQDFFNNIFGLPTVFRWDNYKTAWDVGKLDKYFLNSVIVTCTSVFLSCVMAIMGGYALAKLYIPKANLIISAFMTFSFIPGIAIYISLYSMMGKVGLTGNLLTLILPYTAWQLPFSMYIMKQYFETLPVELIESGRIDGSNEFQAFFSIMLPLVKPAIATILVFNFVGNWGELMWANISTASSIAIKTLPVGLLNFKSEMGVQWGPYCAGIALVTIPLMLVFGYFQKYFVGGLTNGAVKG